MRLLAAVLLVSSGLFAQTVATVTPSGRMSQADRELARSVFTELIDTNTSHSAGSTTAAAEKVRARLLAAGFGDADMVLDGPRADRRNLVIRYRGDGRSGRKPVLFICHLDVVEAPRDQWQTDPFHLTEKDGYFYGRGTQDIKEGDAALVTTLLRMKRDRFVPDRDFIVALTADEEGGPDNGVDWLLQNRRSLLDAAFVINPDAGGVNSQNGKIVDMGVEATEKLYADYEISTAGPGGHSSTPGPDNPIYQLSRALLKVQMSPFPVELNAITTGYIQQRANSETGERAADLRAVLGWNTSPHGGNSGNSDGEWAQAAARLSKDPHWNSTLRTTCVATRLHGGESNNAIPAAATAIVNCRILPGHSPEQVRQQLISSIGDVAVRVRYMSNAEIVTDTAPPTGAMSPPPPQPEVFGPLNRVTHELWPGLPITPDMETGASDSIYTMAAGIPSYGINGFQIDEDNVRYHARDERIGVESFYAGVQFQYLFMKALGTEDGR